MSAEYDFYKNPIPKGSNRKPRLHARIVPRGVITTEMLSEEIHDASSLTTGDVEATITMLSKAIIRNLKQGKRIHIKGWGYLEMTLQCPPIKDPKEIRAESIQFKSVAFRPEIALKKELSTTRFVRAAHKNHSKSRSETEIDNLLTIYFSTHEYITRLEFQQVCRFTKGTANRRLTEMVKAGKLKKEGLDRFPIYVPVPGNYKK